MQQWRARLLLVVLDTILISGAYLLAFWLRLAKEDFAGYIHIIAQTLPVVLLISLFVHLRFGLFHSILRYASIDTATSILKAVVVSVAVSCVVLFLLFRMGGVPRSVFVIHTMAVLLLVGASRLAVRFKRQAVRRTNKSKHILLHGAADMADLVLRGLMGSEQLDYAAVGIVDDDLGKQGRKIHGVEVYGSLKAFQEAVKNDRVDEIWVCHPEIAGDSLRRMTQAAAALRIPVKILPRLERALLGSDLQRLHDPEISDLLRRPPRRLDRARMKEWVAGRRVLITGAGGSIGSELARQIGELGPAVVGLCDFSESSLFHIHRELAAKGSCTVLDPFLVDIRSAVAVDAMFAESRPQIVLHAAAYKHVPMLELNPCEGVRTNVQGLVNVACAAKKAGVPEFVFISTDKAVRPANVMGATKRLGEQIVQVLNKGGATKFMAVRFGNVLGSSGSVIPIFQDQIAKGGPVTVTHPDMTRFFMLIREAVELVIQAGSIGKGGEIFILDMGTPVKISEMAQDMIRLMGKEPGKDVQIVYSGARPGEKIHEELILSPEDAKTPFPDIWIEHEPVPSQEWAELHPGLDTLCELAGKGDKVALLAHLKRLVPRFEPVFEPTKRCLEEISKDLNGLPRVISAGPAFPLTTPRAAPASSPQTAS